MRETKVIVVTDSTFDEIVQRHTLIVIDCWAPWCGPCKPIAQVIEELAEEYAGKIVFGKLQVGKNPLTAKRFQIRAIPTLLIMKNGKELERIVGLPPNAKRYIKAMLEKLVSS